MVNWVVGAGGSAETSCRRRRRGTTAAWQGQEYFLRYPEGSGMARGTYLSSEIGRLYLAEENGCIVTLTIGQAPADDRFGESPLLARAAEEVAEFLAGSRREFTVPVRAEGTPFQQKVWAALREIPYGETSSYGEIARRVGSPRGARAVGMACNRNPVLLMIPCHRVVGSTGSLVGFGGGLPMKEWLLKLERGAAEEGQPWRV